MKFAFVKEVKLTVPHEPYVHLLGLSPNGMLHPILLPVLNAIWCSMCFPAQNPQ